MSGPKLLVDESEFVQAPRVAYRPATVQDAIAFLRETPEGRAAILRAAAVFQTMYTPERSMGGYVNVCLREADRIEREAKEPTP